MIYEDCKGNDIHVKYILINNQTVSLLKWPYYNKNFLREIIKVWGACEPFQKYYGTCEDKAGTWSIGLDGCGILTCQDNRLDINEYVYFWNGVRVDVPKEEFKTTFGPNSPIVETHGDKSPVTTGDNSPITQRKDSIWVQFFWSKGTIGGLIIAGILDVLFILIKKYINKRT